MDRGASVMRKGEYSDRNFKSGECLEPASVPVKEAPSGEKGPAGAGPFDRGTGRVSRGLFRDPGPKTVDQPAAEPAAERQKQRADETGGEGGRAEVGVAEQAFAA